MGRMFNEVSGETKQVAYKVVKGDDNTARVEIDDRKYAPQEISAMVLQKSKQTAEEYLGVIRSGHYSASVFQRRST